MNDYISQLEEYKKQFNESNNLDTKSNKFKIDKLRLEKAIEERRFEINLYWKRAAYFWAFIAVTFAGYGILNNRDFSLLNYCLDDFLYYKFVVICVGIVFSFAWYLVNKGSKYWQESWEYQVDLLEDNVIGPLFKNIFKKNDNDIFIPHLSFPFSVSKINQILSFYIFLIWLSLLINFKIKYLEIDLNVFNYDNINYNITGIITLTIIFYLTRMYKRYIPNEKGKYFRRNKILNPISWKYF